MGVHITVAGDGPVAVFVHGSFGWGVDTFREQLQLSDTYRVVVLDRAGYGQSSASTKPGWPGDTHDLIDVLTDMGGAHLVGQCYGAVVAALAAEERPELVHSLVLIEPPLYQMAADDPNAATVLTACQALAARAVSMSVRDYVTAWITTVMARPPESAALWMDYWNEVDFAAAEATRREHPCTTAPVAFERLAAGSFPKTVVVGGWSPELFPGREKGGRALRAVADRLAERIHARLVVFSESSHNPQMEQSTEFNTFLRSYWEEPPSQRRDRVATAATDGMSRKASTRRAVGV